MTVRVYRSDDASAPTLNGTVGSLIAVLDACLVNGYGAKASSGWAKAFSGTNLAAYRAASGARMYLRVDDTAAQEARLVGYETMSDVNTGTGPFPTSSQQSGGLFARKSNTADTTARPWILIATGTFFHFLPYNGMTTFSATPATSDCSGHFMFGDLVAYKPGDAYQCLIAGATATGTTSGAYAGLTSTGSFTAQAGHFMPRDRTQTGASRTVGKLAVGNHWNGTLMGGTSFPTYPDEVTGGIPMGPIEITEPNGSNINLVRGRVPGLWCPFVNAPGAHADTFSGSGELAGKTFIDLATAQSTTLGRIFLETSDTW